MDTDAGRTGAIHDPLTRQVLGGAFEVANTLGHGFLESVYRKALTHELESRDLQVAQEVPFRVIYKGVDVGVYHADLIVERTLIVELKAVDTLVPAHVGQVLNYLRASGLTSGLLINFGTPRLGYRRVSL